MPPAFLAFDELLVAKGKDRFDKVLSTDILLGEVLPEVDVEPVIDP